MKMYKYLGKANEYDKNLRIRAKIVCRQFELENTLGCHY